ncbi:MAG: hypothetical protein ABEJ34_02850 [Haloferacaceae archaeon]
MVQTNDAVLFTRGDRRTGADPSDPQNAVAPARTPGLLWPEDESVIPGGHCAAATMLSAADVGGRGVGITERRVEYAG